jgi:hypothetical protein
MAGSEEVAPVSVFDIAVPLRPHSNAIDEMTVRGSDAFMASTLNLEQQKRYSAPHDSMFSIKRAISKTDKSTGAPVTYRLHPVTCEWMASLGGIHKMMAARDDGSVIPGST